MVSIFNELGCKVETLGAHEAEDQKTNLNFQHVNEPYQISPHEVSQLFLINSYPI